MTAISVAIILIAIGATAVLSVKLRTAVTERADLQRDIGHSRAVAARERQDCEARLARYATIADAEKERDRLLREASAEGERLITHATAQRDAILRNTEEKRAAIAAAATAESHAAMQQLEQLGREMDALRTDP